MTATEEKPVETTARKPRPRPVVLVAAGIGIVLLFGAVSRLRSDSTPQAVTNTYVRSQPGPQPLFDVPVAFGAGLHIENGKLAGGTGDAAAQAALLAASAMELLRKDLNGDGFEELIVNLQVQGQDPGFFVVQSFEQANRVILEGRGEVAVSGNNLAQTTVAGALRVWKAEANSSGQIYGFAPVPT